MADRDLLFLFDTIENSVAGLRLAVAMLAPSRPAAVNNILRMLASESLWRDQATARLLAVMAVTSS